VTPEAVASARCWCSASSAWRQRVSIALLTRARGENLNTRAAFLEVVNDALGSSPSSRPR
jgi:cobalt-zinc-cadmium efflux system protein